MTNQTKERPILFSAPMVRAILSGQKTVTRREVKKPAALDCLAAGFEPAFLALPGNADLCPYGRVGDRLWVREAWQADAQVNEIAPRELSLGEPIQYPADGASRQTGCSMITPGKTRPSIHMPRWVCRILLEITDVRVERLNDISQEQAEHEGVDCDMSAWTFRDHFQKLWESINGVESWNANPWVWVVEFRRVNP
ncbi:hypothetical protein A264_21769 [Pseudomonas syringae pv. actinidiae ICMP 19071]|uniref:hypothetical protein n=1 Tax=Pseudomonas syringae TaxID=317 RepID=UPI000357600D|nr:hypothetical protein [Pseudomonas syringae]EPM55904.1 hypothetical protein A264_21769 [Pseudomonas syringae pv. actinidiae ICMP 19071]EPM61602.1 hypothetical protein A262_05974 [Pseudomonas syringae pv. actinidiae ICMP 19073]EPM75548.1 hypothetical protein A3SO_21370 [Pseudomonas syringae pv. actinidiae ICMP 19072]OSN66627.1 hypothetical protein BV349_02257 [Pseudomonas syringae pv. actinidiae]OSN70964.1 hypothetical protein BV351_05043 [Pseudomonas syringae pv. actinidiae]